MARSMFSKLTPVMLAVLALSVAVVAAAETGGNSNANDKKSGMVMLKAGGDKQQDIFWGWLDWEGFQMLKPALQQFQEFSKPGTQQISQQILSLPMSSQIYSQIDSMGSQASSVFNPSRLPFVSSVMGSGSGGSSSGTSSTSSGSSTTSTTSSSTTSGSSSGSGSGSGSATGSGSGSGSGSSGGSGNMLEGMINQFTGRRR